MSVESFSNQTQFVQTGNPETVNESSAYAIGQLGSELVIGNKAYKFVQLDSGASNGVAAADNLLAGWKDKANFLVTTDLRFWQGGRNGYAGVLHGAITNAYYGYIQVGGISDVKTAGSPAVGDLAVPNSGTAADVTPITAGTAATYVIVGVYRTTATASVATVDLQSGREI